MKKLLIATCAATALMAVCGTAYAAEPLPEPDYQWYVTGFGGYSFAEEYDYDFINNATGARFDYDISMEDGFVVGGAFGIIWNPNIRSEIEVSYGNFDYDNDYVGTTAGFVGLGETGDVDLFMVFANTWLNANMGWVDPYIGGGLGVGFSDGDLTITNGAGRQWDSSETDFAVQAGAGLRFPVGSNVEIDASYRLRVVFDVDFTSQIAGFRGEGGDIVTHTGQLGVTFKF
jgi:opacity protein-like surface antigen